MGELITTEGVNSAVQRMQLGIDERMQHIIIKEEERSERRKLEQRLERLEMENVATEGVYRNTEESLACRIFCYVYYQSFIGCFICHQEICLLKSNVC